ncbi:MAG: hypothetical protein WD295_01775, partial [Bacteroidota bacterium]
MERMTLAMWGLSGQVTAHAPVRFAPFRFLVCLILLLSGKSPGQTLGVGEWRNHTDMKEVTGIAVRGDTVWGATSGGLFGYDVSGSVFSRFTNSDGLSSNTLTAA